MLRIYEGRGQGKGLDFVDRNQFGNCSGLDVAQTSHTGSFLYRSSKQQSWPMEWILYILDEVGGGVILL